MQKIYSLKTKKTFNRFSFQYISQGKSQLVDVTNIRSSIKNYTKILGSASTSEIILSLMTVAMASIISFWICGDWRGVFGSWFLASQMGGHNRVVHVWHNRVVHVKKKLGYVSLFNTQSQSILSVWVASGMLFPVPDLVQTRQTLISKESIHCMIWWNNLVQSATTRISVVATSLIWNVLAHCLRRLFRKWNEREVATVSQAKQI